MFGIVPSRRGGDIAARNDVWDLRGLFEDFFNDSFFGGMQFAACSIRTDVRETDKEYLIEAEIPGVKKEDIKINIQDDVLTIAVENKVESNEERKNYIRRERRLESSSRSFYLENVKHEDIKAAYEDGILKLILPKREETKSKNHTIDIN